MSSAATTEVASNSHPEPSQPPERPSNVITALAAVMRDLPGIGKDEKSEQGYQYRGIEAITAAAQKLLGRYGVVPVPRVLTRKTVEFSINNRPWTQEELEIVYTVYGPGGIDDRIEVGPVWGLGRDNSDKGANKAMTQAYKVALIQVLCIGDSAHDSDRELAHEADAPAPPDPEAWFHSNDWETKAEHDDFRAKVRATMTEAEEKDRATFRAWREGEGIENARSWTRTEAQQVTLKLESMGLKSGKGDESQPQGEPAPQPEDDPDALLLEPGLIAAYEAAPATLRDGTIAAVRDLSAKEVTDALAQRLHAIGGSEKARRARLAVLLVAESVGNDETLGGSQDVLL